MLYSILLDKSGLQNNCYIPYSCPSKTQVVGTHLKRLIETLQMSSITNILVLKLERYCQFCLKGLSYLIMKVMRNIRGEVLRQ